MSFSAHSLTPRDLKILTMAYEYQGIAVDHIRLRFFPGPGSRTPCYRRISYLVQQGFLARTRLPSLSGQGSGKAFLTIGQNARPILARMLELSRSELARNRIASPLFIAHHLALCDIRLAFEMAARRSAFFTLQDWEGDTRLRRSPVRVKDPRTREDSPIVPDARFTLALSDATEQPFFLEMDMGTVAPKRLRAKLRAYLSSSGNPTPVLFVVPNRTRQAAINRYALAEAQELHADPTIFWTTLRSVNKDSVLGKAIWQVVGGPPALSLENLAAHRNLALGKPIVSSPRRREAA